MPSKIPDSVRVAEAAALAKLFDARQPRLGHRAFAVAFGIGESAGAVAHYLNNRRPLNLNAATKFAQGLGVAIDAFSPRLAAAAALARSVGKAGLDDAAEPANIVAREPAPAWEVWPFPRIDLRRIHQLPKPELRRLEDAWLVAATLLEIQVGKQRAA